MVEEGATEEEIEELEVSVLIVKKLTPHQLPLSDVNRF